MVYTIYYIIYNRYGLYYVIWFRIDMVYAILYNMIIQQQLSAIVPLTKVFLLKILLFSQISWKSSFIVWSPNKLSWLPGSCWLCHHQMPMSSFWLRSFTWSHWSSVDPLGPVRISLTGLMRCSITPRVPSWGWWPGPTPLVRKSQKPPCTSGGRVIRTHLWPLLHLFPSYVWWGDGGWGIYCVIYYCLSNFRSKLQPTGRP